MEETPATKQKTREKAPKLTKKQRGFVKDYARDENGTQAVMNHYDVKDNIVAKSIATENLTKPYIIEAVNSEKETLQSALKEEGITPAYIAKKVNVLLKAKDDKGNTDFTAVDKGLKHATAIYGIVDPTEKPKTQNTYNFIFSAEVQAKVKSIDSLIKAKLINPHVQAPQTDVPVIEKGA